jgi:hypothetical protein
MGKKCSKNFYRLVGNNIQNGAMKGTVKQRHDRDGNHGKGALVLPKISRVVSWVATLWIWMVRREDSGKIEYEYFSTLCPWSQEREGC